MYRVGERERQRRRKLWLAIFIAMLLIIVGASWYLHNLLKPKTSIKQANASTTHLNFNDDATKHYAEPDFAIDLPSSWQPLPRPAGSYQTYNWQRINKATSEAITVYEDTIPLNFAVNRVVIVEPQADRLTLRGGASDNCSAYTKNAPSNTYQGGAPAKWQGVDFLCDQNNQERDVLGTSSTNGVNTVTLKSQTTSHQHKFFFTYTDHSLNPDYTVFYNALSSFHLN